MTLASELKMEKYYYFHFSLNFHSFFFFKKFSLLLQKFHLTVYFGCQMISSEMVQAYIQYIYGAEWGES